MNYLKIIACCLLFMVPVQAMEQENIHYLMSDDQNYDDTKPTILVSTPLFLSLIVTAHLDTGRDQKILNNLLQKIGQAESYLTQLRNINPELKGIRLTQKEFLAGLMSHIKRAAPYSDRAERGEYTVMLNGQKTPLTIGPDIYNPIYVYSSVYPLYGYRVSAEYKQKMQNLTDQFLKIVNKQ